MPQIRVNLRDDIYWRLYALAAREQCKAHEKAELLLTRAVEQEDGDDVSAPAQAVS